MPRVFGADFRLVVFLSDSRVCPQTIGKTTKKDLSDDVTTTFPSLVLSSSDYTTENVRRVDAWQGALVHVRKPRPWFDTVHALVTTVAVAS